MAMAPRRPCVQPKCSQLQPCPVHPVVAWRPMVGPPLTRIRGRELQRRRVRLFATHPWCVECEKEGQQTRATIRDHRIPLAEGGTEDASNEQALCQRHSDVKTQRESARGVRRSFGR
jgi:5-methylcytosine-specific restriction protein A